MSPGTAFTQTSCPVTGTIRSTADSAVAKADLVTMYNDLSDPCTGISGNLNGVTLLPGTYCVGPAAENLNSTLTLSGVGSHILRFDSTFITGAGANVVLRNGARCATNAYQIGSSATLAGSVTGNVVALTTITMTGATVTGRALAREAAVTMTTSTVNRVTCS